MRPVNIAAFAALATTLAACSQSDLASTQTVIDPLVENRDTTVSPGDDFFRYAEGTWIAKHPIPGNERGWGIANVVQEETYTRMRRISEDAGKGKAAAGSTEQKIGDFFAAGMDTVAIEKQGLTPLQPDLDRINAITDITGIANAVARLQTIGAEPMFDAGVYQDEKRSDVEAFHLSQGGLGLPDRDYYFNTDARTANIRREYRAHLAAMFTLLGDDTTTARHNSDVVFNMETALAKASRKLADLRDPYKNYNKFAIASLGTLAPSLDWPALLKGMNVHRVDSVIVGQPEFFREVERSLHASSVSDWKAYLRWNLINTLASNLSAAVDSQNFHFYGTVMSGVKERRPRWKRVLDTQEGLIGDMLGQLYVKQFVPAAMKARYEKLTNDILDAYRERIAALTWMSDSTKKRALEKLNVVTKKVVYPDKWKDYSALTLDRSSYAANVVRASEWVHNYQVNKLGKPVDRTEWTMTPQTYNAYYNPSNNEIVLPAAAFLIPGLPDSLADDAVVYAYAGASTIGHEITHGFDDQGRQYDKDGNLKDWWTAADAKNFTERAARVVKQYSNYVVLDSMHVNGDATQGENIADLGGVLLGYQAFKKTQQYKAGKTLHGLTPDQRFFLAWGLAWLNSVRDEALSVQIMTDVHAPSFLRVNGPLSNVPAFYAAFNITPGAKMWRADSVRASIW